MTMKNNMEKMNKQEQFGYIIVNACEASKEESSYMETRFYVMSKYWNELYKQEKLGHIVVNACLKEESRYIENRFYVMGKYWNELYN